jgi:hypothetical protein
MLVICLVIFVLFFVTAWLAGLPLAWCTGIALFAFLFGLVALTAMVLGKASDRRTK